MVAPATSGTVNISFSCGSGTTRPRNRANTSRSRSLAVEIMSPAANRSDMFHSVTSTSLPSIQSYPRLCAPWMRGSGPAGNDVCRMPSGRKIRTAAWWAYESPVTFSISMPSTV